MGGEILLELEIRKRKKSVKCLGGLGEKKNKTNGLRRCLIIADLKLGIGTNVGISTGQFYPKLMSLLERKSISNTVSLYPRL